MNPQAELARRAEAHGQSKCLLWVFCLETSFADRTSRAFPDYEQRTSGFSSAAAAYRRGISRLHQSSGLAGKNCAECMRVPWVAVGLALSCYLCAISTRGLLACGARSCSDRRSVCGRGALHVLDGSANGRERCSIWRAGAKEMPSRACRPMWVLSNACGGHGSTWCAVQQTCLRS